MNPKAALITVAVTLIGFGGQRVVTQHGVAATTATTELTTDHPDPVPAAPQAPAQVDVNVTVSIPPVIPGPPVEGEKLAPTIQDRPTRPKASYPRCPAEGGAVFPMLTAGPDPGCNRGPVWLRSIDDRECETGREVIEVGPSAPRPLGWGIAGSVFHWGMGDTFDFACHGTPVPPSPCPPPAPQNTPALNQWLCERQHLWESTYVG